MGSEYFPHAANMKAEMEIKMEVELKDEMEIEMEYDEMLIQRLFAPLRN